MVHNHVHIGLRAARERKLCRRLNLSHQVSPSMPCPTTVRLSAAMIAGLPSSNSPSPVRGTREGFCQTFKQPGSPFKSCTPYTAVNSFIRGKGWAGVTCARAPLCSSARPFEEELPTPRRFT